MPESKELSQLGKEEAREIRELEYRTEEPVVGQEKAKADGLCGRCKYLRAIKRRYGERELYCYTLEDDSGRRLRLRNDNPVVECGSFWPVGSPTLNEMVNNAKLVVIKRYNLDSQYL